jgi:hypothetical protein
MTSNPPDPLVILTAIIISVSNRIDTDPDTDPIYPVFAGLVLLAEQTDHPLLIGALKRLEESLDRWHKVPQQQPQPQPQQNWKEQ